MGQYLALETITTTTGHTQFNWQEMKDTSHKTDDTKSPQQWQETHTYSTNPINTNTKTDPLADILSTINKNPTGYVIRQTTNINHKDGQYNEKISIIRTNNKRQRKKNNAIKGQILVTSKEHVFQEIIKLHSREVKYKGLDWDELQKNQTDWHMCSSKNKPGQHISCTNKCHTANCIILQF